MTKINFLAEPKRDPDPLKRYDSQLRYLYLRAIWQDRTAEWVKTQVAIAQEGFLENVCSQRR